MAEAKPLRFSTWALSLVAAVSVGTTAQACEPAEFSDLVADSRSEGVGHVTSVRIVGIRLHVGRVEVLREASVTTGRVLRGAIPATRFSYRFSNDRPGCGWPDHQVRRGDEAVFFFRAREAGAFRALRLRDYALTAPERR